MKKLVQSIDPTDNTYHYQISENRYKIITSIRIYCEDFLKSYVDIHPNSVESEILHILGPSSELDFSKSEFIFEFLKILLSLIKVKKELEKLSTFLNLLLDWLNLKTDFNFSIKEPLSLDCTLQSVRDVLKKHNIVSRILKLKNFSRRLVKIVSCFKGSNEGKRRPIPSVNEIVETLNFENSCQSLFREAIQDLLMFEEDIHWRIKVNEHFKDNLLLQCFNKSKIT